MARRANVDGWRQFLKTLQLDPRVAELWASHARPCIRLNPGETRDADDLAPRLSKLGGEPDLPVGMGWPERPPYQNPEQAKFHEVALEEYPLVFIAQINLKDVAAAGCDLPLPASGLLLFFYDATIQPWGFYLDDATGWRVIYVDGETATERVPTPFELCPVQALQFEPSEDLPTRDWMGENFPDESFDIEDDKLTDEVFNKMHAVEHSFGGWPFPVQNPVEYSCEMMAQGFEVGDPKGGAVDPAEIWKQAADWRLLLQIDTDETMSWSWGDRGMIYFICRESDIAAKRFDRVWVVLQCM